MNPSYDLAIQSVCPVIPLDGGPVRELGLRSTLVEAHRLRELHCPSPLETVSLLRLLLAVLYDCWNPRDEEAFDTHWETLWRAGRFPEEDLNRYFEKRKDRFDLFSQERPFFQTPGLVVDRADSVARLCTEAATGNNATLFDHRSDGTPKAMTPAQAARALVTAQAFALGFGKAATATIDGVPHPRPYFADAILLRGVTVWLSGDNLFQTLMLNYAPPSRGSKDCAAWDLDPPHALMDRVESKERIVEPARGTLDRFTWQSRLIRLLPETDAEGRCVVRRIYFTQGRSADKQPEEPMKAYRRDDAVGDLPIALCTSKAAWRDAHALFSLNSREFRPAAAVQFTADLVRWKVLDCRHMLGMNVVGLATAPNKAGKVLLWRHERMPLPPAILANDALVGYVADAIQHAEDTAVNMRDRVRRVAGLYLAPEMDQPNGRQPDPNEVNRLADLIDPRRAYWPRLEHHFHDFLTRLPNDPGVAREAWRKAVDAERDRAFGEAFTALGRDLRVMRAVAREAAWRRDYALRKQREQQTALQEMTA